MRRLILCFTAALLITVYWTGQSAWAACDGDDPCDQFKMVIITPPKDIDFKIIIITPPKDLDRAMVINPCPKESEAAIIINPTAPPQEKNELFKVPPFTIRNKYSP